MKIGIDVDDTLSNSFEAILADSQKFDIEVAGNNGDLEKLGKVEDHHYIETIYHWKKEQYDQFWTTYFMKIVTQAKVKEQAPEITQKLKQEGNQIYIITSRYEDKMYPDVAKRNRRMVKEKWNCL